MTALPPYSLHYEFINDTIPTYYSVLNCTYIIVIHFKNFKSKTISLSEMELTLSDDGLNIPLETHRDLDIKKYRMAVFENNMTVVIPKKTKQRRFSKLRI